MRSEKNIEYQFMENYQIKYEAPVPAYQFRENISLHSISLERVYCMLVGFLDLRHEPTTNDLGVGFIHLPLQLLEYGGLDWDVLDEAVKLQTHTTTLLWLATHGGSA